MMKRIDPNTRAKLDWLFVPLAILTLLFFGNLYFEWGWDMASWMNSAVLGCAALIFGGYSIAAIKQKCWGEFACAVAGFAILFYGLIGMLARWLVGAPGQ